MKIFEMVLVSFAFLIIVSYIFIANYDEIDKVEVKLVDCIDGDTAKFIVNGKEEKIRFLGIDTPESTNYVEKYGMDASDYTCSVLRNAKSIYLEYDINSDRYDKYSRLLAWVFVDGDNLSELLLSLGYAEVKYIYGDYKYIDDLCNAQKNAYNDNLGIWSIGYNYKDNYCVKNNY